MIRMYGNPQTTTGGKALKFYSSVRVEVSKVGSSNIKEKFGTEEIIVGHSIRVNIKKSKVSAPFRKAEFTIYYDGREQSLVSQIADIALKNGLIPKYDAKNNISPTGRTYRLTVEDETLEAKKKDEVVIELAKYPKIQDFLLQKIKNGEVNIVEEAEKEDDELDNMTDEEFEKEIEEITE